MPAGGNEAKRWMHIDGGGYCEGTSGKYGAKESGNSVRQVFL